ncbi:MAG: hypothetical protein DDT19_02457 [Syntrophomonadaceae bacterium]|nr:hypothetical protein [Bacillota bacterium]
MKKMITIEVFNQEQYEIKNDWPPAAADDFIAWFANKLEAVPVAFRKQAVIKIASISGYENSCNATIKISYDRLETDDEYVAHIASEQMNKEAKTQRELQELVRLEAKYRHGPSSGGQS